MMELAVEIGRIGGVLWNWPCRSGGSGDEGKGYCRVDRENREGEMGLAVEIGRIRRRAGVCL